jgi:hypothetical protein
LKEAQVWGFIALVILVLFSMCFLLLKITKIMTYKKKAELLLEHFWLAGYGHFDLTLEEIAEILKILDGTPKEAKNKLDKLYERLEKIRMG